jgi:uncharacterized membrane protein YdcZ (DUF606 family)
MDQSLLLTAILIGAIVAYGLGTVLFIASLVVYRGRHPGNPLVRAAWAGWGVGFLALIVLLAIAAYPALGALVVALAPLGVLPLFFLVLAFRKPRRRM